MAETCRKRAACSRSPTLETVVQETWWCKGVADARSRLTSSTLRMAGSRWVGGARRSERVGQSRWRTCGEKKRRPLEQIRMDAGARLSTFCRCKKECCSSCAAMRSGDVWEH